MQGAIGEVSGETAVLLTVDSAKLELTPVMARVLASSLNEWADWVEMAAQECRTGGEHAALLKMRNMGSA